MGWNENDQCDELTLEEVNKFLVSYPDFSKKWVQTIIISLLINHMLTQTGSHYLKVSQVNGNIASISLPNCA